MIGDDGEVGSNYYNCHKYLDNIQTWRAETPHSWSPWFTSAPLDKSRGKTWQRGSRKISRDGITWLFSLVAAQNRGVALCRASNTFTPTWSSGRSILVCWWWWWFSKLMRMPICLNLNPRRTEKSGQKPWRSLLFIFSRKPLSHFLYSFPVTASQAWLQRATNWQPDASGARQGGRRSIHTNTHICHT